MARQEGEPRKKLSGIQKIAIGGATGLVLAGAGLIGYENIHGSSATGDPQPAATSATPTPSEAAGTPTPDAKGFQPAEQNGNQWVLRNPDGQEGNMALPQGFTPDKTLVTGDPKILIGTVNSDLSVYSDWENALNTGRPEGDRLAGYNYDYNDFCPTEDFKCNVQGDMFAWRVFQGQEIEIPGIGKLEGGPRRSVVALFLNATPDVVAWDRDELGQVKVKRGFTGTGRSFDASPYSPQFPKEESGLLGHWLFRQAAGTPEKSYIGITDSPENAQETLFVVVVRNQWGEENGQPRYQFQLLDAGIATFNGTNVTISK